MSVNFEMSFWCLQFLQKNHQKQVDLRYHSSKVEFVVCFLEESSDWKNPFDFVWPLLQIGFELIVLNAKNSWVLTSKQLWQLSNTKEKKMRICNETIFQVILVFFSDVMDDPMN